MSSTHLEPEGSSSERRLYIELWYVMVRYGTLPFTFVSVNSVVGGEVCSPAIP